MRKFLHQVRRLVPVAASWLVLTLCSTGTHAHDMNVTGVVRLLLTESAGGHYSLAVLDLQAPPLYDLNGVIPERCAETGSVIGSYRFQCAPALNYDDALQLPWLLSGAVIQVRWEDGSESSAFFRGSGAAIEIPLSGLNAAAGSRAELSLRYLVLGADHILLGPDHLLFVLGLLLLLRGWWKLVQTITAFTVAHSLTLVSAVMGWLPVASAPVESVIALSIVLLAREILTAGKGARHLVHRQPWIVAFLFGLFHGFGFAGALGELGLHAGDIPFALLFFNLGVEAGQLLFIGLLLTTHLLLRRLLRQWRHLQSLPWRAATAYGLGGVAMFWFLQRLPAVISISL